MFTVLSSTLCGVRSSGEASWGRSPSLHTRHKRNRHSRASIGMACQRDEQHHISSATPLSSSTPPSSCSRHPRSIPVCYYSVIRLSTIVAACTARLAGYSVIHPLERLFARFANACHVAVLQLILFAPEAASRSWGGCARCMCSMRVSQVAKDAWSRRQAHVISLSPTVCTCPPKTRIGMINTRGSGRGGR